MCGKNKRSATRTRIMRQPAQSGKTNWPVPLIQVHGDPAANSDY